MHDDMIPSSGQGVPQDFISAYMWIHLAAAQGQKEAVGNRDEVARSMTRHRSRKRSGGPTIMTVCSWNDPAPHSATAPVMADHAENAQRRKANLANLLGGIKRLK